MCIREGAAGRRAWSFLAITFAVASLFTASAWADEAPNLTEASLRSDTSTLQAQPDGTLRLHFGATLPETSVDGLIPVPLRAEVLDASRQTRLVEGRYVKGKASAAGWTGEGTLRTPGGSAFHFVDAYTAGPGGSFLLHRNVTVESVGANDTGFLTRFGCRFAEPTPLPDCEGFLPGVWYLANQNVPPRALAADLRDERIWVREDRLPLPLTMLRRKADGATLLLVHLHPDGGTIPEDKAPGPLTDARLQFAALGVTSPVQPELTLVYPGSEADRTYVGYRRGPQAGDAWRFHPVQTGVQHEYDLLLAGRRAAAFVPAMRWAWRTAYTQAQPAVAKVDVRAVYEASLHLLGNVEESYNGVPGLPFRIPLPGGQFERSGKDVSYQMGFVGQQLPAAYHLLRYGTLQHRSADVRKAGEMLDFWSAQSLTPEGLPRTWYDPFPKPHWRDYRTFMRVASDGMSGALQAWQFAHAHGQEHPTWLQFCRKFGDWLVAHQNPDGSWFREYDFAGHPTNEGKQNTTHPIQFLVGLAAATGDGRYAEAARRAGEFSLIYLDASFAYVGGTADNPNVIDKEAGFMATGAFLALYDLTRDHRYLAAASRAADFMETWVYAWNVPPLPGSSLRGSLPARLPVTGFSLIATGHSAADLFMAGAPFLYERLAVALRDPHYHEMARLLLYNPRQFVDVNGSLGYAQPGLVTEAMGLAIPRDGGVNVWLPWLTVSMIEPLVHLEETFGSMDLLEGRPKFQDPGLGENPKFPTKDTARGVSVTATTGSPSPAAGAAVHQP